MNYFVFFSPPKSGNFRTGNSTLLVFFFKHEYYIFMMNDSEYLVENNKKILQISQLKKYGT